MKQRRVRWIGSGAIALAMAFLCLGHAAETLAATPVQLAPQSAQSAIGVTPFSRAPSKDTARSVPNVAGLLAAELARQSTGRVVSPVEMRLGEPAVNGSGTAADVRRLAALNAVDRVVVGSAARSAGGGVNVDVELRSGHSGAAEAEYRLEPASDPALPSAVEKLATLILADLVQVEPAAVLPPVSAPRAGARGETGNSSSAVEEDEEGGRLSLMPRGKNDDPISIESDELEVLPLEGGRRLVFSRNVRVVQGDIRLSSDRLEAVYPEGASRPETLVAEGHVAIAQGERNAQCQRATYERVLQTIVCRGKAEVVQGCDRVRGREIEFDLEHERVRVSGAASVLIRPDEDGKCVEKEVLD